VCVPDGSQSVEGERHKTLVFLLNNHVIHTWSGHRWYQLTIVGGSSASITLIACCTKFTIGTGCIMLTILIESNRTSSHLIEQNDFLGFVDLRDNDHLVNNTLNDHCSCRLTRVQVEVVVDLVRECNRMNDIRDDCSSSIQTNDNINDRIRNSEYETLIVKSFA
jgi:hypothetical protein